MSATSKVAILGQNGSGKSTLLGLIYGTLEATRGEVIRHHNLRIAYFTQHHVDQLDLSVCALDYMMEKFPGTKELDMRAFLGSFGVKGDLALKPMHLLSGGEKSRVVFAALTFTFPNVLILDEPTNHLDMDTITALVDALNNFDGAVVLVSHDQSLIASIATDLWFVKDGLVARFEGEMEDYCDQVADDAFEYAIRAAELANRMKE